MDKILPLWAWLWVLFSPQTLLIYDNLLHFLLHFSFCRLLPLFSCKKLPGQFWRYTLQTPSVLTLKRVSLKKSLDDTRNAKQSHQFHFTSRKTFSTSLTVSEVNLYIFWSVLQLLCASFTATRGHNAFNNFHIGLLALTSHRCYI